MRACGIDIASAGYSAVALAVNGKPKVVSPWKPPNDKDSEVNKLDLFYKQVYFKLSQFKPDVVVVEQIAGFQNRKVIQALSRFEGAALLAGKRSGCPIVLNVPVTKSRGIVVPKNNSKDKAWKAIRIKYPDFEFGRANAGGMDCADAMVHALAAPIILERK